MIDDFKLEDLLKKKLTERQLEILQLIGATFSRNEIAKILVISPKTVDKHVSELYEKINVNWTPATTPKPQRLTLIWDHFGEEIAEASGEKFKTLEQLLTEKGYKNGKRTGN